MTHSRSTPGYNHIGQDPGLIFSSAPLSSPVSSIFQPPVAVQLLKEEDEEELYGYWRVRARWLHRGSDGIQPADTSKSSNCPSFIVLLRTQDPWRHSSQNSQSAILAHLRVRVPPSLHPRRRQATFVVFVRSNHLGDSTLEPFHIVTITASVWHKELSYLSPNQAIYFSRW